MYELHRYTPTVAAVDARGMAVCSTDYLRDDSSKPVTACTLRVVHRLADRSITRWDARSVRTEHASTSLGGAASFLESADAGWKLNLPGPAGEILSVWNARGFHHQVVYDKQLRPQAACETSPTQTPRCLARMLYGGAAEHTSRRCGRLIRHDDTAGSCFYSGYDLLGRARVQTRTFLSQPEDPDWPEDPAARDALLETVSYTTTETRGALGESLTQCDALGHTRLVTYGVDGSLQQSGLLLASGKLIRLAHQFDYDAAGRLRQQKAGNDVLTCWDYREDSGLLSRLRMTRKDGTTLQDIAYDIDPMGNVRRTDDATIKVSFRSNRRINGICSYRYDTLYRLIEASGRQNPAVSGLADLPAYGDPHETTPYTQAYDYDAAGNLTCLRHLGTQTYTRRMIIADDSNRALPWPEGEAEPDLRDSFDNAGNPHQLQRGQSLQWSGRDQLSMTTLLARSDSANDDERYVYAGDGMRCRKITRYRANGQTRQRELRYLPGIEARNDMARNEAMDVISADAGGTRVTVLCWHSGRPANLPDEQIRYELSDHLGSITIELDEHGRTISREGYLPYGGTAWRAADDTIEADYRTRRYSGKERDATGLYYYGFRYYVPWLTRWLNPDPVGSVDGPILFIFVHDNPASRTDPNGLMDDASDGEGMSFPQALAAIIVILAVLLVMGRVANLGTAPRQRQISLQRPPNSKEWNETWAEQKGETHSLTKASVASLKAFATKWGTEGYYLRALKDSVVHRAHFLALSADESIQLDRAFERTASAGQIFKTREFLRNYSIPFDRHHQAPMQRTHENKGAYTRVRQISGSTINQEFDTANPVSLTKKGVRKASLGASEEHSTGDSSTSTSQTNTIPTYLFTPVFDEQLPRLEVEAQPWAKVQEAIADLNAGREVGHVITEQVVLGYKNVRSVKLPGLEGAKGAGDYRLLVHGKSRMVLGIYSYHARSGKGVVMKKPW